MPLVSKLAGDGDAAALNDLSHTSGSHLVRRNSPVPRAAACLLTMLLAGAIGFGALVLAAVHNAALFAAAVAVSSAVLAFVSWNAVAARSGQGLRLFLDRFPDTDLRLAGDGDLVKVTGVVSCSDISLVSSYEKVENCVYTSTLLYMGRRWGAKVEHIERFAADFYITDAKSGATALVKAGHNSKVVPLIGENVLVNTTKGSTELSLTLKRWLEERNLSPEAELLRLEEGYINEGMSLTVMGMLSKKRGMLVMLPPPEPIDTGCLLRHFLLPVDVDGLLISIASRRHLVPEPGIS